MPWVAAARRQQATKDRGRGGRGGGERKGVMVVSESLGRRKALMSTVVQGRPKDSVPRRLLQARCNIRLLPTMKHAINIPTRGLEFQNLSSLHS